MALASALAAPVASAQTDTPPTPHRHRQQSSPASPPSSAAEPRAPALVVTRQRMAERGIVKTARNRMKGGDCAGALDAFDEALQEPGNDATLYRDRGACHDRLGHPYPAIDDYRTYLTMLPDAVDADAIRSRLQRLEDEVAGRAASGVSESSSAPEASGASAEPGSDASARPEPSKASESADDDLPPKENALAGVYASTPDAVEGGPKPDAPSPQAEDQDQPRSSLRSDRGFALAPFLAARKWFRDGRSFGDGETWAECIGGQLRYSMGTRGALLLEVGYERFDTTNLDVETVSGLTSLLELELRFPLNSRHDHQLLIAPGFGYEYLAYSPGTDSSFSRYTEGGITARLRVSYRHMLAESVALDVSLDAGFAQFSHLSNAAADSHASTAALGGFTVAVLWGL